MKKLGKSFERVKEFCDKKELTINTKKTQLIVFKPVRKTLPDDISLSLDGNIISPVEQVKLLGVTLDCHFTMAAHIKEVTGKCQGLIGMLRRAAPFLPQELLKMAYVALIRSRLEYACGTFAPAAKTHLAKMDIIQKMASRVITGSHYLAHSAPLQDRLGLESLESRRNAHVLKLISNILDEQCHPAFLSYYKTTNSGLLDSNTTVRGRTGNKRFRVYAANLYNATVPDIDTTVQTVGTHH
jgi:hypothetical protein